MSQKPNLKIFFLFTTIALMTSSCHLDKNDVVPDVYVDFYIDLVSDPYFFDLASAIATSVTVSSSTNNWGSRAAGYDDNGIIVYHAYDDEYYAFDRTCPHCYEESNTSVAVTVDMIEAICPECGTVYMLASFGVPSEDGPGRYMLKNYRAIITGQYLHVWNNRY